MAPETAPASDPLLTEAPTDPPKIPRAALWKCLLVPTGVTLVANLITPLAGIQDYAYRLWFLPLIVGPIAGFICTPWFVRILKTCYRGRSLVLMSIGYAFGQLVLTPAIGFGGCMLTAQLQ